MGFLDGHPGNLFEFLDDLVDLGVEFFLALLVAFDLGIEGLALGFEGLGAAEQLILAFVEGSDAQIEFLLLGGDFRLALAGVVLVLLLGLEH